MITNVKPPHRATFATLETSTTLTAAAAPDGTAAAPKPKTNPYLARFMQLAGLTSAHDVERNYRNRETGRAPTVADVAAHMPTSFVVAPGLADVIADTEKRGA